MSYSVILSLIIALTITLPGNSYADEYCELGECWLTAGSTCGYMDDPACGPGATCMGFSGFFGCMCNGGTEMTPEKKCRAGVGAPCDGNRPCNLNANAICHGKENPVCATADGNLNSPCSHIALCNQTKFLMCGVNGVCECNRETVAVNGECLAAFNKPCNVQGSPQTCDVGATCNSNKCGCCCEK